jgi:hypothetical protein
MQLQVIDLCQSYIHKILDLIVCTPFYSRYVKLPSSTTPPEILADPKLFPYFDGCLSAVDGSHIDAHVPDALAPRYRNRKGRLSQNLLAACSFDLALSMHSQGGKVVLLMAMYLVMHGQLILLFLLDAFTSVMLDSQYPMLFLFPTEAFNTIFVSGHEHPFDLKPRKNCSIFGILKLKMPSNGSLEFSSGASGSSHHALNIPWLLKPSFSLPSLPFIISLLIMTLNGRPALNRLLT